MCTFDCVLFWQCSLYSSTAVRHIANEPGLQAYFYIDNVSSFHFR